MTNKIFCGKKKRTTGRFHCDTCACSHERISRDIIICHDLGAIAFSVREKCKNYKRDLKTTVKNILPNEVVKPFFVSLLAGLIIFVIGLIVYRYRSG